MLAETEKRYDLDNISIQGVDGGNVTSYADLLAKADRLGLGEPDPFEEDVKDIPPYSGRGDGAIGGGA